MPSPRRRQVAALLAAVTVLLPGCGGGGSTDTRDARQVLSDAKARVDAAHALHFALSSDNAGGADIYLVGGGGDASRPDGFSGTFQLSFHGAPISLGVNSVGGVFKVKLPFSSKWEQTDPSKYGFSDPGHLLDPRSGLTSLLVQEKTATLDSRDRYQGEELDEVHVTLPGSLVQALLTSADPSQDVDAEVGVAVDSREVRRVKLVGPFFVKGRNSTYTVILTDYGESVTVTPPS